MKFKISEALSVYLDLIRIVAALSVFAYHANRIMFHVKNYFVFGQGPQAVAIFFVLSGFVISYISAARETDWRSYTLARFVRIYPVAVLAIIVTCCSDLTGWVLRPDFYSHLMIESQPIDVISIVRTLSFTNELWSKHILFGTNGPFWSLGFEVWYYIIFGLALTLTRFKLCMAAIAWFGIVGPQISVYLLLWMLGSLTFHNIASGKIKFPRLIALMFFVLTFTVYVAFYMMYGRYMTSIFDADSYHVMISNFLAFFFVGCLASANIWLFDMIYTRSVVFSAGVTRCIRWMAGASFTFYLMHLPVMLFLDAVLFDGQLTALDGIIVCGLTIAVCLALAELAERRKRVFLSAILSLTAWVRRLTAQTI